MNRNESELKAKKLDDKFHRISNKVSRIEKLPRDFGTEFFLHPSEIHTIENVGLNPGINITELAIKQGVTKGAVSQVIVKLEKKKLIIKMKEIDNDKTIFLKLSEDGKKAFDGHKTFHSEIHSPLVELLETASLEKIAFVEEFLSVVETFCDKALKTTR